MGNQQFIDWVFRNFREVPKRSNEGRGIRVKDLRETFSAAFPDSSKDVLDEAIHAAIIDGRLIAVNLENAPDYRGKSTLSSVVPVSSVARGNPMLYRADQVPRRVRVCLEQLDRNIRRALYSISIS